MGVGETLVPDFMANVTVCVWELIMFNISHGSSRCWGPWFAGTLQRQSFASSVPWRGRRSHRLLQIWALPGMGIMASDKLLHLWALAHLTNGGRE